MLQISGKPITSLIKGVLHKRPLRPVRSNTLRSIGFIAASLIINCGTPPAEQDAAIPEPDAPITSPLIDDFEDGNYHCETLGGYWTGFNGFEVVVQDGVLRASGSGNWPGFNVRASSARNVSEYSAIEFRVRGDVGRIKIELFGEDLISFETSSFETITEEFSTIRLELVRDEDGSPVPLLRQFQVMAAGDGTSGWIEIDDIRLI